MDSLYQQFKQKAAEIADLTGCLSLLSWDQETYMPANGVNLRARQSATLSAIQHGLIVEDLMPLLRQLQREDGLTAEERQNVEQAMVTVSKQVKLPQKFVAELASHTARCQQAWERAKKTGDFNAFEPELRQMINMKRQQAEYYGYDFCPYDALLDSYEPGCLSSDISALFDKMRAPLQALVNQLQQVPQVDNSISTAFVPHDLQWRFGLRVLEQLGYDFSSGRQDLSSHPFTIALGNTDVRITTRVNESSIGQMLYSSIHECGHAMYEQGLLAENYGIPAGEACSLAIHESQSRIWENNVGRSLSFWQYYWPEFSAIFADKLVGHGPESAFRAFNRVEPTLIRTEADELTYHFHILLRFEIERDLINGQIQTKDLPEIWNEKMKQYLGLEVPNHQLGVLQDIHWSLGLIGYFPTYTLGSFYAAQFMHHAELANPNLASEFVKGNFSNLKKWLSDNIYRYGRLYNSSDLCIKATGNPLDVTYFMDYIRKKMSLVYQITL